MRYDTDGITGNNDTWRATLLPFKSYDKYAKKDFFYYMHCRLQMKLFCQTYFFFCGKTNI